MPRPSTLPVWATNTNYLAGPAVGTPTVVAPSSSAQQEGWEPGQKPGAQNQNWWQNLVYQWVNWLAGGVIDGTWEFTGASVKIDGTLEVVGAMTFDSDVTVAANKNVIISGSGLYKRGVKGRRFPAMGGTISGAGTFQVASNDFTAGWKATAINDLLAIPIMVNEGERITEVKCTVRGDATATCNMQLFRTSGPSSAATAIIGAGGLNTTASNTDQVLDATGLAETTSAGNGYYVRFKINGSSVTQAVWVVSVEVFTDVP